MYVGGHEGPEDNYSNRNNMISHVLDSHYIVSLPIFVFLFECSKLSASLHVLGYDTGECCELLDPVYFTYADCSITDK